MEPSLLSTIDTKNNSEKLSIPKQQSVDTNRQKDNQILPNTIDELKANNQYNNTDTIIPKSNKINKNSSESNNNSNSCSTNNLNFDSNQKCQTTNSSGDLVNRSNERLLMYKEYVNHIYNNDDSLLDCDLEKQNSQNQLTTSVMTCSSSSESSSTSKKIDKCNGDGEDSEDVEPLLESRYDNDELTKFKGIIKSPSATSFADKKVPLTTSSTSAKVRSNKRLSWQGSSSNSNENCERPTNLHVQFESPSNTGILLPQSSSKKHCEFNSQASTPSKNSVRIQDENLESNSSGSSSSDEDDSEDKYQVQIPDGGYGWVVVFASFIINLIADGITFSFGMFYVEFLTYFGESKGKTALIGSIFMATPLLSGPVASFLTDRYGCRKVTIFGSILAAFGFVLSALSNSIEMLFINFGIIAGFGLSLCYVAAVVIVAYYFDKRRSLATGISVCGSGVGTFLFSPIIQYLIEEYGWRGATLILAGIFLNMCVCGCLMRDLEWTTMEAKEKRKREGKKKSIDSYSISNSTNTAGACGTSGNLVNGNDTQVILEQGINGEEFEDPRVFSSLINLPTFVKNGEKIPIEVLELLTKNRNVSDILLQNYPHLLDGVSFSNPNSQPESQSESRQALSPTTIDNCLNENNQLHRHTIQIGDANTGPNPWLGRCNSHRPHRHQNHRMNATTAAFFKDLKMHRHSLTYRGAMLNINRYRLRASSCPDIYRNSMTTIAKEKSAWYQTITEFKTLFVDIMDFSYFTDIRFLLFAISNFILYTWYDLIYVYLPDYAIEILNIDEKNASMLISLIGIINMFGEIFLGWAGDLKNSNSTYIYSACMAFCGLSVIIVPFFRSFEAVCVLSGAFGLFIAANYSLTSIILVELITIDRFTNAYGLLLLIQGVANLIGPPIAGYLFDWTGSYNLSFYLAGGFIIISGIMLLIVPIIDKCRKLKSKLQSSVTNNNLHANEHQEKILTNVIQENGKLMSEYCCKDSKKDSAMV